MSEKELMNIAETSEIIVAGYAFMKREDGFISILNLERPTSAMVVNMNSELLETNMDEIEQKIVLDLCKKNLQFMED